MDEKRHTSIEVIDENCQFQWKRKDRLPVKLDKSCWFWLTRKEKPWGEVGRESLGFMDENRKNFSLSWTRVAGFGGRENRSFQ